jgi:hypothetical protein
MNGTPAISSLGPLLFPEQPFAVSSQPPSFGPVLIHRSI